MALILLTGHPTSGKSHRAHQLLSYFHTLAAAYSKPLTITLLSDHSLSLPRTSFASAAAEKTARAALASAVKRLLTPTTVLIVDSHNYIKGFRYQLHCEAKALGIRSGVLHVAVSPARAREVNEARLHEGRAVGGAGEGDAYEPQAHAELVQRYEEPNGRNRWDSPLFTVPWEDEVVDAQGIWDAVVLGIRSKAGVKEELPAVRPNAATVLPRATREGALHELDRATSSVVAQVLGYVREWPEVQESGGAVEVDVGGGERTEVVVPAGRVSAAGLQRLRRQFIALQRQQMGSLGVGGVGKGKDGGGEVDVGRTFVGWLGDALERGV